jgi:hypothetical protein
VSLELTPGELKMADHASVDAQAVARLLSARPVSGQNLHDAEKLARQVLASIQYLKTQSGAATPPYQVHRPGRD